MRDRIRAVERLYIQMLNREVVMPQSQTTTYFHSTPFSRMEEFAILKAIRRYCPVLAKEIVPDQKGVARGIAITTEEPVPEEIEETLGLIPLKRP
jgi:hypothetical protein